MEKTIYYHPYLLSQGLPKKYTALILIGMIAVYFVQLQGAFVEYAYSTKYQVIVHNHTIHLRCPSLHHEIHSVDQMIYIYK